MMQDPKDDPDRKLEPSHRPPALTQRAFRWLWMGIILCALAGMGSLLWLESRHSAAIHALSNAGADLTFSDRWSLISSETPPMSIQNSFRNVDQILFACDDNEVDILRGMRQLRSVRELELGKFSDFQVVYELLPGLPNLQKLTLYGIPHPQPMQRTGGIEGKIPQAVLSRLNGCAALKEVTFWGATLSSVDLQAIHELKAIESLTLHKCIFDKNDISQFESKTSVQVRVYPSARESSVGQE
ncbi:MAG: hypothetical protein JWM11_5943 [Planctomycetaceae bacterium]|nr:hypothetical protein [Planctomycetaceae bacterium]